MRPAAEQRPGGRNARAIVSRDAHSSNNNGSSDSDSSSTSGGSTGEAGNIRGPVAAAGDVKIEDCVFKESELKLVAKLRITNTNNTGKTYDYRVDVAFKVTKANKATKG